MNPDEQKTEDLILASKQTLLEKLTKQSFTIPHIKLGIWLVLFAILWLVTPFMLPIPDTPGYETNIFNTIFMLDVILFLEWPIIVAGYELGKKEQKKKMLKGLL